MLCGSLDGRGIWGTVDTRVCVAESLCCPLETIMMLLIGYTSIETVKFFFFLKKDKNKQHFKKYRGIVLYKETKEI